MDILAEQLGISKKTIYGLFSDKDDLVLQCIRNTIVKHQHTVRQIINDSSNVIEAIHQISINGQEIYHSINPLFFHDLKRYYPEIHITMFKEGDFRDGTATSTLLKKGIREGVFDKNLNIGIVQTCWQELISLMHNPDVFPLGDYYKKDLIENIMYPYIKGICTNKGLILLEQYFVKMGHEIHV